MQFKDLPTSSTVLSSGSSCNAPQCTWHLLGGSGVAALHLSVSGIFSVGLHLSVFGIFSVGLEGFLDRQTDRRVLCSHVLSPRLTTFISFSCLSSRGNVLTMASECWFLLSWGSLDSFILKLGAYRGFGEAFPQLNKFHFFLTCKDFY